MSGPNAQVTGSGVAPAGAPLPGPWGPGTPHTTTGGIQEAITALTTGGNAGGTVDIEANTIYNISTTIYVPSNIDMESNMAGGETPSVTPIYPAGYLNYTPATGTCLAYVATASPGLSKAYLRGVAVVGHTSGPLVRRSGCRQVHFEDCYVFNYSGPGLMSDGNNTPGLNTEDCNVKRLYVVGIPAIQIGWDLPSAEPMHCNDCTWDDVTAEAPGFSVTTGNYVLDVLHGKGHLFKNFYSRSAGPLVHLDAGTGALAGSITLRGGEFLAGGTTPTAIQIDGGVVALEDLTLGSGNINLAGPSSGNMIATLRLRGFRATGGAIVVSGGILEADRFSDLTGATVTKTGGLAYFPSGGRLINSLGVPSSAGSDVPGDLSSLTSALPATITSGTTYQNTSGARLKIHVPVTLNPTLTGAATAYASVGPASASTALPIFTWPAALATGFTIDVVIDVPNDWYWSITVANASIGTGVAFGEASD
jgi:hypothetical protein